MINPDSGKITEFTIPSTDSQPSGITPGFKNDIWFTESTSNKIGHVGQ
jgi:streptogramin lyase